jgi:hypothetical protein
VGSQALTKDEATALRSHLAISDEGRGGRRYAPYAFTEQGVAMLSGVLLSKTAVSVNVAIMRAFVELRGAETPRGLMRVVSRAGIAALK